MQQHKISSRATQLKMWHTQLKILEEGCQNANQCYWTPSCRWREELINLEAIQTFPNKSWQVKCQYDHRSPWKQWQHLSSICHSPEICTSGWSLFLPLCGRVVQYRMEHNIKGPGNAQPLEPALRPGWLEQLPIPSSTFAVLEESY